MELAKALAELTKIKLALGDPPLRERAISNLKILMVANKVSYSKLASMVGAKKPFISMFMTGKKGRQPLELFVRMAAALGIEKNVNLLFEKDLFNEIRRVLGR